MRWLRMMPIVFFLLSLSVNAADSLTLGKCAGRKDDVTRETCLKYILTILNDLRGKSIKSKLPINRDSREMNSTERTFDKMTEMATSFWDFARDFLDVRDSKISLMDDDLRNQEITRANRHFRRFLLSFLIGVMLKLGAFFPVVVAGLFLLGNTAFVFGKTALFLSGLVAFLRYFYFHSEADHNAPSKNERLDYERVDDFVRRYHRPKYSNYDFKYNQ